MSMLNIILSSKARARIFKLLFGCATPELHNREIFRRSSLSESAVRQELGKLTRLGLVIRRRDGNRVYYKANRNHALFTDIRLLVLKTNGLVDILKPKLSTADIRVAFAYGPLVKSEETARSAIDLLVIGRISQMGLDLHLSDMVDKLGRKIRPLVLSEAEYREKLDFGDRSFKSILSGSKIFVTGDQRELDRLSEINAEQI